MNKIIDKRNTCESVPQKHNSFIDILEIPSSNPNMVTMGLSGNYNKPNAKIVFEIGISEENVAEHR